ncbi:MAG: AMP-binding protein, partial [Bauldia litoralis]
MSATAQPTTEREGAADWTKDHPFTDLTLAPPRVEVERRDNGEVVLTNPVPLGDYPTQLSDDLRRHADTHPDRIFLAERGADGDWVRVSYAEARRRVDSISQWLLDNGHGPDNPIACLSDNSVRFALLQLGAMQVGIPFLPVSPAYSLMSKDFARIRYVCEQFTPSLIYAENLALFKPALDAVNPRAQLVAAHGVDAIAGAVPFEDLLAATPGPAVEEAYARVGPDTVGKILLTSGSTGFPKGVINTQRNMCASHTQMTQVWPFLTERPPVICDWLPWNHTFGANWCFNMILRHGGTFYVDEGKPAPGKFEATLRNLRDVKVTMLLNVARAYDALIPELEKDEAFARHLFSDLDYVFYAGAGLPRGLWDRLEALSIKVRGKRTPILTSLGSTETGPPALVCHWTADVTGSVGLPLPGLAAKLAPAGGKTEVRFKGANICPGYYRDDERTAQAF